MRLEPTHLWAKTRSETWYLIQSMQGCPKGTYWFLLWWLKNTNTSCTFQKSLQFTKWAPILKEQLRQSALHLWRHWNNMSFLCALDSRVHNLSAISAHVQHQHYQSFYMETTTTHITIKPFLNMSTLTVNKQKNSHKCL